MISDVLWWEWLTLLYFTVIGPLVSYFWIREMTKMTHGGKLEMTGTEFVDRKFVISNPKKFLPIFVLFPIIGLPILLIFFTWIIFIDP